MNRLETLRALMKKAGATGLILNSTLSESYLSGFNFEDGYVTVTEKEAFVVTDFRYTEAANNKLKDTPFTVIEAKGGTLREAFATLENEKTIAFEEDDVTVALFERMRTLAGDRELLGVASGMLSKMRKVKDEGELDAIDEAQKITDACFAHVLEWIKPDVTERELALEMEFFMRHRGAEGMAFDIIAVSGSHSSLPHGVPEDRKLEKGFLTLDFGAKKGGYCSDMTRTIVIGKADAEMKRLYETVLRAQTEALAYLGEGKSCREADAVARRIIDGAGYEGCFGHSLGHGVGRYIHELPRLSTAAGEETLVAGHVVTVEPGIYVPGKYGCRIEDMVAITKDGCRNFTKSPKQLIELF